MSSFIAEGFGYLASLLLALSLLVNNDLRFRWLNTGGCAAFIIYGVLINAFPIILTNAILFLINVYSLVKIYRKKESFDLVEFGQGNALVKKFLSYYKENIHSYFPSFQWKANERCICFMVLRDMAIANIFIASVNDDVAEVELNYTIPKYRDFKVGRFIFEKEKDFLLSKGINKVVYKQVANKNHLHFLKVTGFVKEEYNGHSCIVKHLA
ncbi:MAG TPA: hypothetical protein VF609_01645 [Flavisolibacter sp.]